MIKNTELTGKRVVGAIDSLLLDDVRYRQMAESALREGVPDASNRLYRVLKDVLNGR